MINTLINDSIRAGNLTEAAVSYQLELTLLLFTLPPSFCRLWCFILLSIVEEDLFDSFSYFGQIFNITLILIFFVKSSSNLALSGFEQRYNVFPIISGGRVLCIPPLRVFHGTLTPDITGKTLHRFRRYTLRDKRSSIFPKTS